MSRARDIADGKFSGAVVAASADFTGTVEAADLSDGTTTVGTEYVTNGSAKAWVNLNGTGTIAARDSLNVSSLTDNGTGDYTVNIDSNMADGNYAVSCTVEPEAANPDHVRMASVYYNTRAAASVRLRTGGFPAELGPDVFGYFAVIFGDLA